MNKILIVDNKELALNSVSSVIENAGYSYHTVNNGINALEEVRKNGYVLVLLDYKLPDQDGLQILDEIKTLKPGLPVIMLSGNDDTRLAVEAMKKGVADFITVPFKNGELINTIKDILKDDEPNVESIILKNGVNKTFNPDVVISSKLMKDIYDKVLIVAPTNMTVLLQGESGCGKEVVANLIHKMSTRNEGQFVAVDCGAIPETLFESELFGYEKGAFTDAKSSREGKFEQADKGTLFLDEILNLSDLSQVKLLRVLEEKSLTRLGGNKLETIDVRIITASNSDLLEAVNNKKFRADLFYRLNEFQINIPPLRERKDGLTELINQFIKNANAELNKEVEEVDKKVLEQMYEYSWPGNVRELRNVIRRAVLLTEGKTIYSIDLSGIPNTNAPFNTENNDSSFRENTKNAEREIIINALIQNDWNKSKTAKLLNMNLRTLYRKIKTLNISDSK